MTTIVKRGVVVGLEWLCAVIDVMPAVRRDDGGWAFCRHGCLGCYPLNLANRSADLDDRWDTGVWRKV